MLMVTLVLRLCVSEMSKKVVGVLRAVVGEGTDATQVLSQQLSTLPLTHDYALAELNLITNHYLTHLAADTWLDHTAPVVNLGTPVEEEMEEEWTCP